VGDEVGCAAADHEVSFLTAFLGRADHRWAQAKRHGPCARGGRLRDRLQCQAEIDEDFPAGAIVLPADLSDEDQTAALLGRGHRGNRPDRRIDQRREHDRTGFAWDDASRATWDMHIQTNLRAPFVLIQQFARSAAAAA
jgi:NAD(P)-dependent dehydrogenase (short-subunit alcohol dehydrogenase family)